LLGAGAGMADFSGFQKEELNGHYEVKQNVILQGRETYWNVSGRYFAYWQGTLKRWSMCGAESFEDVAKGSSLGWAFMMDEVSFLETARWMERSGDGWCESLVKVIVVLARQMGQHPRQAFDMSGVRTKATAAAERCVAWEPTTTQGDHSDLRERGRKRSFSAGAAGTSWGKALPANNWSQDGTNTQAKFKDTPWQHGAAVENSVSKLNRIDWATVQREPFLREFIPYVNPNAHDASASRQALKIRIEDDPVGPDATPAPVHHLKTCRAFLGGYTGH